MRKEITGLRMRFGLPFWEFGVIYFVVPSSFRYVLSIGVRIRGRESIILYGRGEVCESGLFVAKSLSWDRYGFCFFVGRCWFLLGVGFGERASHRTTWAVYIRYGNHF